MGRPREFNREEVLDRAVALFWRNGYRGTSIQSLVEGTGLNRGSLYDTFGDKQGLFLASVERYRATVVARRLAALEGQGSPRRRIEAFFDDLIAFSTGEGRLLGCLMTNAAIERAVDDRDTQVCVAANLGEMEAAFRRTLTQARAAGELGSHRPVEDLARFLTACVQGLRVMAKAAPDETRLRRVAGTALAVLD